MYFNIVHKGLNKIFPMHRKFYFHRFSSNSSSMSAIKLEEQKTTRKIENRDPI